MGSFPEMYNDPVGIITTLLKKRLSESNIFNFPAVTYINKEKQKMNLPFRIQPW